MSPNISRITWGLAAVLLACAVWLALTEQAQAWSIATFNGWKAREIAFKKGRGYRYVCGAEHLVANHDQAGRQVIVLNNTRTGEETEIPGTENMEYVGSDPQCGKIFYCSTPKGSLDLVSPASLYVYDRALKKNAHVNTMSIKGGQYKRDYLSFTAKHIVGDKGQQTAVLPDGSEIAIVPVKDIIKNDNCEHVLWAHDDSLFYGYSQGDTSFTKYDVRTKEHNYIKVPELISNRKGDYTLFTAALSPDDKYLYIEYNMFSKLCFGCQNILMKIDTSDKDHVLDVSIPYVDRWIVLHNDGIVYTLRSKISNSLIKTNMYLHCRQKIHICSLYIDEINLRYGMYPSPTANKFYLFIEVHDKKDRIVEISTKAR